MTWAPIIVSDADLPAGLARGEALSAVQVAAGAWADALRSCGLPPLQVRDVAAIRWVESDGISHVVFRGEPWCHNEHCGPGRSYAPSATAMTVVHTGAGGLFEGDVELRAHGFGRLSGTEGRSPGERYGWTREGETVTLAEVLTHEFGHLLGLEDRCGATGNPAEPASPCSSADWTSIMASPARLRGPSAVDAAALCQRWPGGTASSAASEPRGKVVEHAPWALGLIAAMAILVALWRWRPSLP